MSEPIRALSNYRTKEDEMDIKDLIETSLHVDRIDPLIVGLSVLMIVVFIFSIYWVVRGEVGGEEKKWKE